MAHRMPGPVAHQKTGVFYYRKVVPKPLREMVGKTEILVSLDTKNLREAETRYRPISVEVEAQIEAHWRAFRAERPPLSKKQIAGICGEFHRWLVAQHDGDPGSKEKWAAKVAFQKTVWGPTAKRVGGIGAVYMKDLRRFLKEQEIIVDENEIWPLSLAVARAGYMANETLMRAADGDYSPHPDVKRFPEWRQVEPTLNIPKRTLVVAEHWDGYATESGLDASTIKSWKPMLTKLTDFLNTGRKNGDKTDNIAGLTAYQVIDWKNHLLASGLKPQTVREGYFAAARSFFSWAVNEQKAPSNPFAGIRIKVPKKLKVREPFFSDAEAGLILSESLRQSDDRASAEWKMAKRWIPWVMAYTGARVNEITQMRGVDLTLQRIEGEDVWVFRITPEAGDSNKTKEFREVPLHPHLVEQGFPEFVASQGDGHFFFNSARKRKADSKLPQSQKVGEKLANWVREIGVEDMNVDPNHGWRHRFNNQADLAGVHPEVRDGIAGHVPGTEGAKYGGNVPLPVKWTAIKMLRRYDVVAATGPLPDTERRRKNSRDRMATAKRAKARANAQRKLPVKARDPEDD
jgi:integrase